MKGEEFIIHRWGLERKKLPHDRDTLFVNYNENIKKEKKKKKQRRSK